MKAIRTALIAAPLALALAACGDNETAETEMAEGPSPANVELPEVPVTYPEVPLDARSTVDYEGTYAQSTPQGERMITLGDDDTYVMRDETGTETRGTFNWYSDNSRILIREDGETQVYAIADGAIYRLADENTPTTGPMTAEQAYMRDNQAMNSGAM